MQRHIQECKVGKRTRYRKHQHKDTIKGDATFRDISFYMYNHIIFMLFQQYDKSILQILSSQGMGL